MIVIFLVLVILGLLAAIAYPLVRGSSSEEEEEIPQDPYLEELLSKKEAAYSALKELEFDYGTGKLSEEDFTELRDQYKAKAVAILREIDEAEEGDSIDSQIEHAVEELRVSTKSPKRKVGVAAETVCAQCGVINDVGDKFCSDCGASLAEQPKRNVCRNCGLDYQEGDKFCSGCGEALMAVRG
jgi:hypothetical protein